MPSSSMTDQTMDHAAMYARDGFALVTDPVFSDDLVARARAGMDMIRQGEYDTGDGVYESQWKPGNDTDILCKIEMPQMANLAIRELVSDPGLGALTARVTGSEMVQVFWTQLLYKPPGADAKTVVGWHQDKSYWGAWEAGDGLFTAWVALSDVTEDAGPMRFVRGSHTWGFQADKGDFFGSDNEALRNGFRVPAGETWEEVPAILPPGGVSLHHNLTLHGSEPNLSDGPRCSLAIHMRSEKARLAEGKGNYLTSYLDNPDYNPVIAGTLDGV